MERLKSKSFILFAAAVLVLAGVAAAQLAPTDEGREPAA